MNYSLILIYLLVVCSSCFSTKVSQQFYNNEIKFYGVHVRDTIFDLGQNQFFIDGVLSAKVDSLHFIFYSNSAKNSLKYFNSMSESIKIEYLGSNQRPSDMNYTTASIAKWLSDTFVLQSNSVDKIILRDKYYLINNLDKTVSSLKRILKPNGTLIVIQDEIKQAWKYCEKKGLPHPIESELVQYFESRGFRKIQSFRGVSLQRYGFMNFGAFPEKIQIHFQKP